MRCRQLWVRRRGGNNSASGRESPVPLPTAQPSSAASGSVVINDSARANRMFCTDGVIEVVVDGTDETRELAAARVVAAVRRGEIALAASDATDDEFEASVIAQLEAEHAMLAPCTSVDLTSVDLFRPCSA